MKYITPTELIHAKTSALGIQKILNARYRDWWVLDKVIDAGEYSIYYFNFVYSELPEAVVVNS